MIVKYVTFPRWFRYDGITLFPFIFIHKRLQGKDIRVLLNHEMIHYHQQKECLVLVFYLLYAMSFLWQFFRRFDCYWAYKHVIFEREAYKEQCNLDYLSCRKRYAWIRRKY